MLLFDDIVNVLPGLGMMHREISEFVSRELLIHLGQPVDLGLLKEVIGRRLGELLLCLVYAAA